MRFFLALLCVFCLTLAAFGQGAATAPCPCGPSCPCSPCDCGALRAWMAGDIAMLTTLAQPDPFAIGNKVAPAPIAVPPGYVALTIYVPASQAGHLDRTASQYLPQPTYYAQPVYSQPVYYGAGACSNGSCGVSMGGFSGGSCANGSCGTGGGRGLLGRR